MLFFARFCSSIIFSVLVSRGQIENEADLASIAALIEPNLSRVDEAEAVREREIEIEIEMMPESFGSILTDYV